MSKKKGEINLTVFTSVLSILIGGSILYKYEGNDIKAMLLYKDINDQYVNEETTEEVPSEEVVIPSVQIEVPTETEESEEPEVVITPEEQDSYLLDKDYQFLDIDFDGLNDINEDVVGYIQMPNTNIDYPVAQGDNNEYYLHHSLENEETSCGTIFADSRVDLSLGDDSSSVQNSTISIFGHHMKNQTMFHDLMKYKDQSFVDENPYGVYYSEDGSVYALEIVAGYLTTGDTDKNFYIKNIDDQEKLDEYMEYVNENALVSTDVDVEVGDKLVTLVTCSYEHDNYRYVVLCKAVKQYTNDKEVEESKSLSK